MTSIGPKPLSSGKHEPVRRGRKGMTEAIQLNIGRGRPSKFVLTPLSAPLFAGAARRQLEAEEALFAGAARRQLEAEEALFVVGEPGDGCYRLEEGPLKNVITSLAGHDRHLALPWPAAIDR